MTIHRRSLIALPALLAAPAVLSGPARATPYVRDALTALAAGQPIANAVTRPYGCVVKYRTQA